MADSENSKCIKCGLKQEIKGDKIIKCNGTCDGFIHYVCSSFKPTELKFLETNNKNIKWYCDKCCGSKKEPNDMYTKLDDMNQKLLVLTDIINAQTIKIEKHNNILTNLKTTDESRRITHSPKETISRPTTRSRTLNTDVTDEFTKLHLQLTTGLPEIEKEKENGNNSFSASKIEKHKVQTNISKKKNDTPKRNINTDVTSASVESLKKTQVREMSTNRNRKTIRGQRTDTVIKAEENRKWVFISQLVKTTTENDVITYLRDNGVNVLQCNRLEIKNNEIAAFKIAIKEELYEEMFDPALWPVNTIIRPYRQTNFRKTAIIPKQK